MRTTLFLLVAIAAHAAGPSVDQAKLAEIKPRMQSFVDKGAIAGAVTLVQVKGERMHLEATGWQDIEKKQPMKPDAIFQVMSMTKPVTSVAILMLVEEGRVALNDPVSKYLPEFAPKKITLRDMLTHTSGMPEMGPEATREIYTKFHYTLREAVLLYSQLNLLFEPGAKIQYSNTAMASLGRIVESVSGMPYEKFCDERIFKPLGMKDTFFYPTPDRYSRIAQAYSVSAQNPQLTSAGDRIYRKGAKYPMPEGGMYSTAEDMAKFYQAMLDGGKPLVSKAAVQAMTMNHTGELGGPRGGFGLGWQVDRQGGFGHAGALGTQGWVVPSKKMVRVFMIQKFGAPTSEILNAFANIATAAVSD